MALVTQNLTDHQHFLNTLALALYGAYLFFLMLCLFVGYLFQPSL
jgi:hypothetical protein